MIARNTIRKSSIDLEINAHCDGFKLQEEVCEWYYTQLMPALQSALQQYESTEEVIAIEQIALDVELDLTKNWMQDLQKEVTRHVKENLHQLSQGTFGNEDGQVKSIWQNFKQALEYYLMHGFFPWNKQFPDKNSFNREFTLWLKEKDSGLLLDLPVISRQLSQNRLVLLLEEQNFSLFFSKLTGLIPGSLDDFIEDAATIRKVLASSSQGPGKGLDTEKNVPEIKKVLLQQFSQGSSHDLFRRAAENYMGELLQYVGNEKILWNLKKIKSPAFSTLICGGKMLSKVKKGKEGIREVRRPFYGGGKEQKEPQQGKEEIGNKAQPQQKARGSRKENVQNNRQNEIKKDSKTEKNIYAVDKEAREKVGQALQEGIFIQHAGAVIIASFLPSLFSRAGLLMENNVHDVPKAAALVYYVLTAKEDPAEFELVLEKILCGLEVEAALAGSFTLDEKMKEEADEMLKSVIQHWAILKNTSIEGLRESFLQREGIVSQKDGKWLLQVEQKPYDMLLQQLPWSISIVKLPWMKQMLITEWV